ncbi:MAG TPA: condensation domain-containing protein, partial [Burkholderiaceae bacterium]|nr:condensation domain-containing protein [Burkholderiaceae bacterium]
MSQRSISSRLAGLPTRERDRLLEQARQRGARRIASDDGADIPSADRTQPLPLSFAQQRLWFLSRLDERAGTALHIPTAVRLLGTLHKPALQAALNRIAARHEALRTCFEPTADGAVQRIAAPEVGLHVGHDDLSALPEPERQPQLQQLADAEAMAPFDLERGPLIRARLVRLADTDHVLLVTLHHIVSDGWSMGVLIREFGALYSAFVQGQPDPLPPLPIQYADFAAWQRRWLEGPMLQRQLQFWTEHLQGAPDLLELPTDRPRPPVQDFAGGTVNIELDVELTAQLKALARRHGATLFATLLAAWGALLARLSGQGEVVIGTSTAYRNRAEFEPLIGLFGNVLAMRVSLADNPSVAELLQRVQATALAAQDTQDVPFEQVIAALNPKRSLAYQPVFQAMFTWQSAPVGDLHLAGLRAEPARLSSRTAKFDIELILRESHGRIQGGLDYLCALFDPATIERHAAQFTTLLRAMVGNDRAHAARLPLLPTAERESLRSFNATDTAFPTGLCIHQLFEQQVLRTPEAPALVFDDTTLTYTELNIRSNRLARHLVGLGVRPDVRVAICLPRGIELVVSILATLKAGGAYVPLDPEYPTERLAFMLQESAPRVVLSEAAQLDRLPANRAMSRAKVVDFAQPHAWCDLPADDLQPQKLGLHPSHLAYVIYTSGSTGRPKGV